MMGKITDEIARREGYLEARERLAQWMIGHGYATGHGDTVEDLLAELERQHVRLPVWASDRKTAQQLYEALLFAALEDRDKNEKELQIIMKVFASVRESTLAILDAREDRWHNLAQQYYRDGEQRSAEDCGVRAGECEEVANMIRGEST